MLDFQQIKDQYPPNIQAFEKYILQEYIQYKMLQAIFESKYASKLVFLGGTAIRIIYGNNRFSEDIDLDNFGLSWNEFESMIQVVKRFLELEGFIVEARNVKMGVYRCYLKFPEILRKLGIVPLQQQKLHIQIDTTPQRFDYDADIKILNKFDVFTEIKVTPADILLSQKIFTSVNRDRPKGRDFFDITFLFSRTNPNYRYLKQNLAIDSADDLRSEITEKIRGFDFDDLSKDLERFIINPDHIKRVKMFREFWEQVELE